MATAKHINFDTTEDRSLIAAQAVEDPEILAALIESLSADQRRLRQFSAAAIKEVASKQPELLLGAVEDIVDGLHRPEAQTRWECLETLAYVAPGYGESLDDAIEGAEVSLFDEESGMAHLAALRFLCSYGSLSAKRAAQVWPLIEEGVQVYHGDSEFIDMLEAVETFAAGKIGKAVREQVCSRMQFDANNYSGDIGKRAASIIETCNKAK